MTYSMTSLAGAEYTRGDCYADCELKCMEANGGVWIPLLNDYCAASCFDDAGCEDLPYSGDEYELPDLPGAVLPPVPSEGSEPTPSPGGGGSTKPKPGSSSSATKNGGTTTSTSDDDEPTPVAPSGGKIALVLFTLGAVVAGGVWLMRRRKR